ncbi:MAG: diguanylate cyclase [Desulfosarcinaceae bacterium]
MPGYDQARALENARDIRTRMLETVYLTSVPAGVRLQASFGVATYPHDASDIKAILAKADLAMFRIKTTGKNAVGCIGDPDSCS